MVLLEDVLVPKNTGKAFEVNKGQHLRVIGESIVDFVAFNRGNLKERFDQARTKVLQGKIFISIGDKLISKLGNPMFTIVEDKYRDQGTHDLQAGACRGMMYQREYESGLYPEVFQGVKREDLPDRGCWENLSESLQPWRIQPEDIPSPFNIFQSMEIDGRSGRMRFLKTMAIPGTYLEMRAEMQCIVGVSACPCAGLGKPIRIQVYQP
jgi:uncharacterized protein YcgI (DUF1989 family)